MTRTRRIVFVSFVFLLAWAAFPRGGSAGGDWLPIPPEDLTLKDNAKQPGADAMVLYREVNVDAKEASVDNYLRIKVFTQTGVEQQADIELPYNKAQESIRAIRARTIRPDGSVVEFQGKPFDKEIVKGSGIKYLAKTFTMPDVQPGCIIEYSYREQYDDRFYWTLGWTVQYDLFTRLARFSIKPDDSSYSLPLSYRIYALPTGTPPIQKQGSLYTLEIRDLSGIEQEQLMPPPSALQARVEFYYRNRDEPESETPDQYWKRMGKTWNGQVDHFLDKKKELAAEVSQDVNGSDTPEMKLRKLYARAGKIRNLDIEDEKSQKETKQEDIKPNNNVDDVLKHGYGHGLDINFLLIGLARAAGFDAADLRVAPRSGMYFFPQRESARDLGAELVWVRAGSKDYYLDPAAHYYPFGVLPWYETAANGLRVTKDGSEIVTTPPPVAANATTVRHADLNVDSQMEITGRLEVEFGGQEAATRRYDNRDEDDSGRKKALGDEIKGWLPLGSTFEVTGVSDWDDAEKPIRVEGTLKIPSFVKSAMQRMLMPLEMFQTSEVGWFQSQKRVNEVDFTNPYERSDDLIIHLPPGYKIEALPVAQKLAPGPVSYEISATQQENTLEVKRHLLISNIRFPKESYFGLRSFFSIVRTDDNAQAMFQMAQQAKNN
ncbi:MAG TPA: DUF3857 domain-containing protein [Candidatus Acidoferrales bacterium]